MMKKSVQLSLIMLMVSVSAAVVYDNHSTPMTEAVVVELDGNLSLANEEFDPGPGLEVLLQPTRHYCCGCLPPFLECLEACGSDNACKYACRTEYIQCEKSCD